jgi:hypothetical protein
MGNLQKHYTRSEPNKSNQSFSSGLIIRQKEPNNLETPVDRVDLSKGLVRPGPERKQEVNNT